MLLVAFPPAVVTEMGPVVALEGTEVVILESEFTVYVAATPLKVTAVVPVKPPPVIVTAVPGAPLVGVKLLILGCTVKLPELVTAPPLVVITIFPLLAPLGTVAVTEPSELTVTFVEATPPNVTFVVCVRLTPVIVTEVPSGPLAGAKVVICGATRKVLILVRVPELVVTVTNPVVAPLGTVAVKNVVPDRVIVDAATVPKVTTEELVKPCPRMPILAPTLPEVLTRPANGGKLLFRL